MKKTAIIALASFAAVVGALLSVTPTYAEEQTTPTTWLQVSPTAVTMTIDPGEEVYGDSESCPNTLDAGCAIEVKNSGTDAFTYRIYASPYVVTGENYELSFDANASTSYTQIYRWITFLDSEGNYVNELRMTINPGETQTIYYRIDVPDDLPGGSQYGVIWAQTEKGAAESSTSVQTVSQAGMVISARSSGDTRQEASITDYDFQRFSFGGNLTANATVTNTGNTDFDAYYYYTAKTIFGKEIYSENDSIAAYPETTYHINVDWQDVPFLGIFQVNFRISAAGNVKEETHVVVVMPVFIMILLILLLTVIIVWIIIIIRKRKERKARTLV